MSITTLKWIGTILVLLASILNTLNTPELQKYVYPFNLYTAFLGTTTLLTVSFKQRDFPYLVLNGIIMLIVISGILLSLKDTALAKLILN